MTMYLFKALTCILLLLTALSGSDLSADTAEIKIGVIVPLSGTLAAIGTATKNGIELAREQNSKHTERLEFIYEDSQSKTPNAITAYRTLVSQHGVKMIYAFNSANAHALGPLTEREKIPFISFAFESTPAKGKDFMFRPFSPSEHYVRDLLKHLRGEAKDDRKYHIITTQFSFLRSMLDAFKSYLHSDEELLILADLPPSETDFRAVLSRLRAKTPSRLGIFLLPHQIAAFLKQANELGLSFDSYGTDFFESAVPLMSNPKLLQGAYYPDNHPSASFRKIYRERFNNEDQLTFAAAAYEMTLHTARLLTAPGNYSGEAIIRAFRTSSPISESVMGPFSMVSEKKYGQYFRFPIVIKEIQGDHGVKIASYNELQLNE